MNIEYVRGSNFRKLSNGKMVMRLMYNPDTMMEVWGGKHDYINDITDIYSNEFNQEKRSEHVQLYIDINQNGYLSLPSGVGYKIEKINSKETLEWKNKLKRKDLLN